MNVKIHPTHLTGTINAVPSKSQAHRALICAAFADKQTNIRCKGDSEDINATIACLSALGAGIEKTQNGYTIYPIRRPRTDAAVSLPCKESGSTFRFLLPIVGALGRRASFILQGRLHKRPLSPLYEELVRHGSTLSPQGTVPFLTAGQLQPGCYKLEAGISSQFISGLLFALPLLDGDSKLRLIGPIESFPYIEMTLAMLETFGLTILFDNESFSISGGQIYRSPSVLSVEGDWSNTAFWLCAGAIGTGGIICTGLDVDSLQGDRAILDILARFGARVRKDNSAVSVAGGKLRGIEINATDIPDLVPVLAVVGAVADGITLIRNAGRLRMKESDRLSAITSVLRHLGADIRETANELIICGKPALRGGQISSWGDHRIAMAAAIAASVCTEPIVIRDAGAVKKSYPNFFDDMCLLGGSYQILESR